MSLASPDVRFFDDRLRDDARPYGSSLILSRNWKNTGAVRNHCNRMAGPGIQKVDFEENDMLIALRATLLVLFIAAPFGEHRTAADLRQPADDFAAGAVLTCPHNDRPAIDGVSREVDTWTAGKKRAFAPGASGENA